MKTLNVLESPEYPDIPECKNCQVGSISRDSIEAAWLAGILDGEGCIHTCWQKTFRNTLGHFRTRIEIRNTDPFLMQRITEILTNWGAKYFLSYIKHKNESYKENMALVISSYKGIHIVLNNVYPYLTGKKEEAKIMIDFINWRLFEHPMQGCNGGINMTVLQDRMRKLTADLKTVKQRRYSLQRLPRRTSGILDLSCLEVKV